MRESLFRGMDVNGCGMLEGDLLRFRKTDKRLYQSIICPSEFNFATRTSSYCTLNVGFWKEVKSETVGEYTGLKDKNGVKIFEGDNVKAFRHNEDEFTEIVTFRNGCFWFGNWSWSEFISYFRNIEIIGNIHQNPELLNQ